MPVPPVLPDLPAARLPPAPVLRSGVGALATFDDEGVLLAGEALAPKKRRGRPPQSRAAVVRAPAPLTSDEMAFLRAWVQGVAVLEAARRYLPAAAQQDAPSAAAYLRHLLARLQFACQALATGEAAARQAEGFAAQLQQLRERARVADAVQEGRAHQEGPAGATPPAGEVDAAGSASAPTVTRSAAPLLPTLEEFALRFDADMYSEAELIELYEEEFAPGAGAASVMDGATAMDAGAGEGGHVAASQSPVVPTTAAPGTLAPAYPSGSIDPPPVDLAQLQVLLDTLGPRVSAAPRADSPCAHWLAPALAAALQDQAGVATLGELAGWINARGPRWYDRLAGLGRHRAARLLAWLAHHEQPLGVVLRDRLRRAAGLASDWEGEGANAAGVTPRSIRAGPPGAVGASFQLAAAGAAGPTALVPLAQLVWPGELLGVEGTFRGHGANTLGAHDDRAALQAWLATCIANKSNATRLVSQRAVERLVLWALRERRCALSSLTGLDFVAFREFLYAPPTHWCSTERVVRGASEWRPLRGPLGEVAVRQILGVVQRMYAHWQAAGYLRANAAHGVTPRRAPASALAQQVPTSSAALAVPGARSFSEQDLQAMRRTLEGLPDGPSRRRLRAILCLFLECGLRRSEVQALSFGQVQPVRVGNFVSGMAKLQVRGKGGKLRELPLSANALQALHAHLQDRRQLIADGTLAPHYARLTPQETPLLSILKMVRAAGRPGPGPTPADAARRANVDGRLSGGQVYTLLKGFFAKVAQRADLGPGAGDFRRASTHWLRHTFAQRVLASSSASLPTVQALMGHGSIATTGVYLTADLQERARATAAVPGVF
jgi:site-specific recombinase XerC